MIDNILLEMQQQVASNNTVDDYKRLLEEATKKIEKFSKIDTDTSIQNPLAAILIEVYVKCPEAVWKCAKEHAVISSICEKMFPQTLEVAIREKSS